MKEKTKKKRIFLFFTLLRKLKTLTFFFVTSEISTFQFGVL